MAVGLLKFCYNVLNSNDCYQGLTLPKTQFMAKHFPDELKIVKERYTKKQKL